MSLSQYFDSGIVKLHRPNEAFDTQACDYDNVLVVYHAQCVDGFTAASICWTACNKVTLIPAEYDKPIMWPTVTGRTWILFVDFCPVAGLLHQLADMYDRVTLIDHHIGQQQVAEDVIKRDRMEVLFTTERSGAYLTWLFVHGTEPTSIVQAVDDYDRWQFKLSYTRAIHAALGARPNVPEEWALFTNARLDRTSQYALLTSLEHQGMAVLGQHDKHVQDIMASQRPRLLRLLMEDPDNGTAWPLFVHVYNAPKWLASDIGHYLAKQYGIGGTYIINGNSTVVSLRSDARFNVMEIAKRYGGGGHKTAAGFTVPNQVLDMMFREGELARGGNGG